MPAPKNLAVNNARQAIETAKAMIGDDWATALAIATNLSPDHWQGIESGIIQAPPAAVEAIGYVDQIMLFVEALSIDTGSHKAKKIAPHPNVEVQRIAIALLAEIAADIRPL